MTSTKISFYYTSITHSLDHKTHVLFENWLWPNEWLTPASKHLDSTLARFVFDKIEPSTGTPHTYFCAYLMVARIYDRLAATEQSSLLNLLLKDITL